MDDSFCATEMGLQSVTVKTDYHACMQKHFNTAGPSTSELHYLLDPLSRIELATLLPLIQQHRYFVLHAPRQTGKTTCLLALRDALNAVGDYSAIYVNIETAQAARNDVNAASQAILSKLAQQAQTTLNLESIEEQREQLLARGAFDAIGSALRLLASTAAKPVVLFLDKVDALVGDSLISLLRQIRAGYTDRPKYFPQTIVLCGVRDVRDYRMTLSDGEVITGGSAFNIKAESLRLGDFSEAEIRALYLQHTHATGQSFSESALALAWHLTRGQPWLVNALAEQAVWKTKGNLDRSIEIDAEKLRAASETLILRNDTHLDQLSDKLREPRVRAIIEPMLLGFGIDASESDEQYLIDLGLVRRIDGRKNLVPANAIYAEVLPRVLNSLTQASLDAEHIRSSWKDASGRLNPRQFLLNFLDFWRKDGEPMMRTVPYHEAAPHLVLMAYLQRVINGGGGGSALSSHASCAAERAHTDVRTGVAEAGCVGRIEREYAVGSGRLDLLLVYGDQQMAIEVKVWRDKRPDPLIDGMEQIERYLARLNLTSGFLVLFDQRTSAPEWEQRMSVSEVKTEAGRDVMVLRG